MMKYVQPLLIAIVFVRSLAQQEVYNGPSEYTIGSMERWDKNLNPPDTVYNENCAIVDRDACALQASYLNPKKKNDYAFVEVLSAQVNSVHGCFLTFDVLVIDGVEIGDGIIPTVVWSQDNDSTIADYAVSLPTPDDINYNNARMYLCPKRLLDTWELQAVGQDDIGKPSSTVTPRDGDTPFTVRAFFETNPGVDVDNKLPAKTFIVDVYTGVGAKEDDCSTGTPLVNDGAFIITQTVSNNKWVNYNEEFKDIAGKKFPQFKGGLVGEAIVTLSDPTYQPIFTADASNIEGQGTVDFCIRISLQAESNGRITSYVDAKKKITLGLRAVFAQDMGVGKSDTKSYEKTLLTEVDVVSFVCNNKNEAVKDGKSYRLGQNFRVCVTPTEAGTDEGYVVDGYEELSCGGVSLITNNKPTDPFTTIKSSNVNNRLAVHSVLTPDLANGDSVNCEGKVSMSILTPQRDRRYLAPSIIDLATTSGAGGEKSYEGRFTMNIKMDLPPSIIESSASSTLPSCVAIIGLVSVFPFIVSFWM